MTFTVPPESSPEPGKSSEIRPTSPMARFENPRSEGPQQLGSRIAEFQHYRDRFRSGIDNRQPG